MDKETDVKFGEEIKDEDLVVQAKKWILESQTYHDYLLKKQDLAYEYYVGNQTEKEFVPSISSNTCENRVFEGVETLAPIATATAHHFVIMPGEETEMSKARSTKLQKILDIKYRTEFVQRKLEEATRHLLLYRFGVLKWYWDTVKDDVGIKVIDPRLMLVPKLRCDPHDLPYKIEIQEYTPEDIKEEFPEFKDWDDLKLSETTVNKNEKNTESKKTYQVFEIWTNDYTLWLCGETILDKGTNLYFDYEEPTNNFLDDPRDPYVFLTTFNVGDEPFGSLSLVEAVMDIQDEINVQKRQIIGGNWEFKIRKVALSPGLHTIEGGVLITRKRRKIRRLICKN